MREWEANGNKNDCRSTLLRLMANESDISGGQKCIIFHPINAIIQWISVDYIVSMGPIRWNFLLVLYSILIKENKLNFSLENAEYAVFFLLRNQIFIFVVKLRPIENFTCDKAFLLYPFMNTDIDWPPRTELILILLHTRATYTRAHTHTQCHYLLFSFYLIASIELFISIFIFRHFKNIPIESATSTGTRRMEICHKTIDKIDSVVTFKIEIH